jgi:hypothetical protein
MVAVRTEGGRSFVEERLEKWLGLELTIQGASLGLPCDLVVEHLESRDFGFPGGPGFRAEELRLGLRPSSRLRVSAYRCALNLARRPDGSWAPGCFSKLGDLPGRTVAELSRLTAGFRDGVALDVSEGAVTWFDADGVQGVEARGIVFRLAPAAVPGRRMHHYYLAVRNVVGAEAVQGHDVEREWLASDMHEYLELYGESRGLPPSGAAFWEGKP